MSLAVGTQIGPYEIVSAIGSGGMGEVYKARDARLKRDVALKVLPKTFSNNRERLVRFEREAEVLAALNHPHIAAIYGLEESDGLNALVMELVEGEDLAARIARGPIPLEEALSIAKQIADALDTAHQCGIIHRDLKPANIKVRSDGTVKVLDFGLAKTVDAATSGVASHSPTLTSPVMTAQGVILGTAAYMAPEQAKGQRVDKRADIWAFGCMLFEMLAGKPAFPGDTMTDIIAAVVKNEPDWMRLPADTPANVRRVLTRCLRKDANARLRDIGDARIEIEDREETQSSSNAPAASETWRRHQKLTWTVAALLGLAPLAAVVVLQFRASPAVYPVEFSIAPPQNSRFGGIVPSVAVAPDGGHVAVVLASRTKRATLWVRPLGTLEYREMPGTEDAISPFWKPDSREIGFFAEEKLRTVPLGGGVPFDVCDAPGLPGERGATWNRDDVIVFMSKDGRLHKVSSKGGLPVPVTSFHAGDTRHRWPSFLPDGQYFLYLAERNVTSELRVSSLDGTSGFSLGPSETNALYSAGHIFYQSAGQLVARRFNATTRQVAGDPIPLAPMTTFPFALGLGAFSVADSVLAFHPRPPVMDTQLTWRDRGGTAVGTVGERGRLFGLDLSPDGKRVAVSTMTVPQDNIDIWIFDAVPNGNRVRLTTDAGREFDPSWSPDGKQVAFVSNRTGRFSLFRRPSNGSARTSC